jgi:hypothetical protein
MQVSPSTSATYKRNALRISVDADLTFVFQVFDTGSPIDEALLIHTCRTAANQLNYQVRKSS